MVKAGVLVVACSGMVATVGLQSSAAAPGPTAVSAVPTSPRSALGVMPAAPRVTPVATRGRTTVVSKRPARTTQALMIGSRAQLMARGQLGQQGYIGMTVVTAATTGRPDERVSRSTTRAETKTDRTQESTVTTESSDDRDGSSASASGTSDDEPTSASTSSAEPTGSTSAAADDSATGISTSDDPSEPAESADPGDAAGAGDSADPGEPDDQPGEDQPGEDQPTAGDGPGSASFGDAVIAIAIRYEGTPYRYGGTTPAGFDCSGFTSFVMAKLGYDLPRTSGAQRAATHRISRSQAVAGDLVFMPGHVGIYAGHGMMIDSPRSGLSISLRPVYSSSATYGRVG